MAKKVIVTTQGVVDGRSTNVAKEIVTDDFDLREDYYDYMNGVKTGPHGNSVNGAMIGSNYYVRFADVIDISVEEIEDEDEEV